MLSDILQTIDFRELGLELQAARKRRGVRQEDAAQVINVARTTMIAIEKGERRITAQELVKLARHYKCQISDLLRHRPHVDPSGEQFRGPQELEANDRQEIEPFVARLIEYARQYVELEQIMASPLARRYPALYPSIGGVESEVAENIALEERQRLGLGDGPLPNLRDLLEQYVGLRIFYEPLPNRFSEIYLYDEALGGCMTINKNHREDRRRWSMAHGYLHFLAHRNDIDIVILNDPWEKSSRERLADAFAGHFLMPISGLKRRVNDIKQQKGKFTPSDILSLAHLYGVSAEAFTLRLEDLSLLPSGTWDNLKKRGFHVDQLRDQLGIPSIEGTDDFFSVRYQSLALEAFLAGIISEGQFAKIVGTSRLDARLIALSRESLGSDEKELEGE